MAKQLKDLSSEDKAFFATTMTSMLSILKVRFTDEQIKKFLSKKNIEEVLKLITELNEERLNGK